MTVEQISHVAITTTDDRSAIEVAEIMDTEGVGALVVEDNGSVVGIVTDREIAWQSPNTTAISRMSLSAT